MVRMLTGLSMENKEFFPEVILSRKAFLSIGLPSQDSVDGANICLEVLLKGSLDPKTDLVVNLTDVQKVLNSFMEKYDHQYFRGSIQEFSQSAYEVLSQNLKFDNAELFELRVHAGSDQTIICKALDFDSKN